LFFFGVIISVGGLGFMGYLALTSELMYASLGATYANMLILDAINKDVCINTCTIPQCNNWRPL
jgi:hypothetical protein